MPFSKTRFEESEVKPCSDSPSAHLHPLGKHIHQSHVADDCLTPEEIEARLQDAVHKTHDFFPHPYAFPLVPFPCGWGLYFCIYCTHKLHMRASTTQVITQSSISPTATGRGRNSLWLICYIITACDRGQGCACANIR